MKNCKICKFNFTGMCRRYPPQVFPVPAQNPLTQEVQIQAITMPVQVADDYVCGEFSEKTPALASV